jgi:hypothetical protein
VSAIAQEIIPEQTSLPACLFENPPRLVNMLAMLRFNAHHWVAVSSTIGQLIMDIGSGRSPSGESMQLIGSSLGLLQRECAHLRRLKDGLQVGGDIQAFRFSLMEVQQRIWDELEARKFLALSAENEKYYDDCGFSQVVAERFPEASFDANEAGKCLALERPTACAYHLMRVTEFGLQQVGKKLGMKDERPNWDPIIRKIDSELKKDYKDREFRGMADFLANSSAHLNAVKLAWRNRVMHVDRKHTMEEAKEIYNATCGLMRYIAENLPLDQSGGFLASIRGIIGS